MLTANGISLITSDLSYVLLTAILGWNSLDSRTQITYLSLDLKVDPDTVESWAFWIGLR